jgi:filamentous hemagglutinin family protein
LKKVDRTGLQQKWLATALTAWIAGQFAYGNPVGPAVVSGQASFATRGNQLSVTNTPGAIINWQQFSIQANETTRFIQPSAASAVLNRVTGVNPSLLLGTLQSNGRVFLINPNGILFGAGAQIDVAGLVASSLNLRNEDFLAGRMNFAGIPAQPAAVVNQGRITAQPGGRVFLIGSAVDNQGVITAPNGDIVLAAGNSVRVTDSASADLQVAITAPADRALNLSDVTHGSRGIYSGLVRNSGIINANSVVRGADGRILLKASDGAQLEAGSVASANGSGGGRIVVDGGQGAAVVAGNLEATGSAARGGTIAVTGARAGVLDGARIDASGASAGGSVMIGGDLHGAAIANGDLALPTSQLTYVATGAQIRADAVTSGDGGKVVVWSDATTAYYGAISARGGTLGGNGGSVEVSGKQSLVFRGSADTRAPRGNTGILLLDPLAITIQAGAGDGDDTDALNNSFAGSPSGVTGTVLATDTTPTTIFQSELQGIAATTNISLAATNSITINALAGGNLNLAQNAGHSVAFQAGTFAMNTGDTITTAGGALSIITTAGGAAIGGLATGGGAITLNLAGASTVDGVISGAGTTLTKQGAGTLTLNGANTYTGLTTVNAGTLNLNATGANSIAGNLTVAGGSAVLQQSDQIANSATVLVSGGTLGMGVNNDTVNALQLTGGNINGSGGTLTSNTAFNLQAGAVSAILGGVVGANKTGAGAVTFTGANTYTGLTTVTAGTLNLNTTAANAITGNLTVAGGTAVLQQSNQIPNAANVVVSSGTLDIGANSDTVNGVQLTGGSINGSGGTLTSATTFDLQLGSASAILGGSVGVTKTGVGTVILSGANTYTGATTISAGALSVATIGNGSVAGNLGAASAAAGSLVLDGGTLQYTGVSAATDRVITLTPGSTASAIDVTANNLTLTSAIPASTGALTKLGAGALTFTGANAYTGLTTASAGTLNLNTTGANSIAGNLTVAGGTAVLQQADQIPNAANVVVSGGTLDIGANSDTVNGVQLTGGSIIGNGGTLTSATTFDLQSGSASAILAGATAGIGVTKTGGGTVTLSGVNTFTGVTTISAGALSVGTIGNGGVAGNLGAATAAAGNLVLGGGTLQYTGASTSTDRVITLTPGTTSGIDVTAGNLSLSSAIPASTGALTKLGGGTLTLLVPNLYTGTTTVNAGTLAYGISNAIATGSVTVNGGTLALGLNQSDTVGTVTVAGGSITGTGTSSLTSTGTYEMQSGSVSAILAGAGIPLNKTTGGTVTLSGVNTFTGVTTINAGTLSVGTIGNGGVAGNLGQATAAAGNLVLGGGTLQYTGATASTDRVITLTPGTTSAIDVTTNNLSLSSGIPASTGALTKLGAGTLTLLVPNLYTGTTTVNAGTLLYGTSNALATGPVTVDGATAILALGNNQSDTVGTVTVANGGSITGTGTSTLTSTGTFEMQSGSVSAILAGAGIPLNKTTAGTVTLSGANTYTGLTTVSAGTLSLNTSGANSIVGNLTITTGGTTVLQQSDQIADNTSNISVAGGTLDIGANSDTVHGVQLLSGLIAGTTGTLTSLTDFDMQSGTVTAILGGSFGLVKSSPGTIVLSGANTYTGATTINGGILSINTIANVGGGASSLGAPTTIANGTIALGTATLLYTGTGHSSDRIINLTGNGTIDASGSGTLTLTGGITGAAQNLILTGTGLATESGAITTTTGTVTKTGAGTWTLSGAAANTYTGTTTVNAGTLQLGKTAGVNAIGGDLVVGDDLGGANADVVRLLAANQIPDTASVTVTTSGRFDLNGFDDTINGMTLKSGTASGANVTTGAGTLTLGNDVALNVNGTGAIGATISGLVNLGGATRTFTIADGAAVSDLTVSAAISNGALTKAGPGNMTLAGASTYAGATAVNAGTLTVTNANALGGTGTGTTVAGGATLAINNAAIVAEPVTLNGDGVGGIGALTGTGAASLAGTVTLATASTIGVATGADALTLSGTLEGPGALSLIGAGTVTFGAAAGGTTALASLTQNAATTLRLNGGLVRTTGDQTYNGPVSTGGATTLRTTLNGNVTVNSAINATAGTLTLDTGAGNATLDNVLNDFGTVQATSGGTVSIKDANALTLGASNIGRITALTQSLDLTLGGNVTATGGGNSITLVAKRNFLNPGANTLDGGAGGRWLIYSTNPAADTRGGLAYDFKQYNATFGVTAVAQPAGNGFLYTVAPSVTPTLTGAVTKVYDGTATATLAPANYAFTGALDGDTIALNGATSGTYDTRHVGTSKLVSVSGLTLAGASNGAATVYGYQLVGTAASANIGAITPAALSVTANNEAKNYGTTFTFNGAEFTPSGLQNGETIGSVTLTSAGAAPTAHVASSPYPIAPSAATGGTFTPSDYTISYVPGTFTVNAAALTVTANDQVKAYGTPFTFAGTEFTSNGLKNGETIGSVTLTSAGAPSTAAATTPVAAPPYPIVASAATGGTFTTSDYAITYVPGAFMVNAAGIALTVTANNLTKTYGTALAFTGTEFSATGLQNGETIGRVTLTSPGAAAAAPVTGNPYAITPTSASGGTFTPSNYTITYVNGVLTVIPAPLTIKADNKSRLPGAPDPLFTATYTGFQLGETPTVLTGKLAFATTASASSPVGNYPLVPSGQSSPNYAITYEDGTFTVKQPLSTNEALVNGLLAALYRLGIGDYSADLYECMGAGSGPGSATAMAAPPKGVTTKARRKCISSGGSGGGGGRLVIDIPPPKP